MTIELMASPKEVVLTIADALEQVAGETGKTFAQIALNWVLQRPGVCTAIYAARTEAQLRDNLGAVGWQLTPHQVAALDHASEQKPAYPYSHRHQFPTINPPVVPYYKVEKSSAASGRFVQLGIDCRQQLRIVRCHIRIEARNHGAVAADQEFFEIPQYLGGAIALQAVAGQLGFEGAFVRVDCLRLGSGERFVQRVLARSLDHQFLRQRKRDTEIARAKSGDFFVAARLLRTEFIGRKANHDQAGGLLFRE